MIIPINIKNYIDRFLSYVMLVMLTVFMVFSYFFFFEKANIEFTNVPFEVDKERYLTGEQASIVTRSCAKRAGRFSYTVKIVNMVTGESRVVANVERNLIKGCSEDDIGLAIPSTLDSGQYAFYFDIVNKGVYQQFLYDIAQSEQFDVRRVEPVKINE